MNLNALITAPARFGLKLGSRAFDLVRTRLGGGPLVDDNILQRDVEAEVMASRRAPKGKIEIDVTDGVVWLRGEVKSRAAVEELENRAQSVDGVARVENLLRVAKPARRAKPAAQAKAQERPAPKRTARPKPAAATAPPPAGEPATPATPPPAAQEQRPVTRRFNAEETPGSDAEPTPSEIARAGEGRRPAPFGAEGTGAAPSAGDATPAASPQTEPAAETSADVAAAPEPAAVGSPPAPFPSSSNGSGDDDTA